MYAKGLTTGEISSHFAEIFPRKREGPPGASVSKETISRITDKVLEEMQDWAARPLDEVYAAIFIDAIVVKVRDGQVANRPIYAAIGVSLDGHRDVLGLWAGTGGEGAKFFDVRADGYPKSGHPGCVLPGLRRTQRSAGGRRERLAGHHSPNLRRAFDRQTRSGCHLERTGTRSNVISSRSTRRLPEAAARAAFDELAEHWGKTYPAIIRLWNNAWQGGGPALHVVLGGSSRSSITTPRYGECCALPMLLSP